MTQSKAQQIGDFGENLFRTLLPPGWLPHKRDPDEYTDFLVERVIERKLSGEKILVQVKSSTNVTPERLGAKIDVATIKFAKRSRIPIFLSLVDIKRRRGYFIFLTEYADKLGENSPVWKQTSHVVNLSDRCDIGSEVEFGNAVLDAWKYMSVKYPGPLDASARAAAKEIMINDDRFDIVAQYDGQRTNFICRPRREDIIIDVKIEAQGEQAQQKLRRFVTRGGDLMPVDGLVIRVQDLPGHNGETRECGISIVNDSPGSLKWDLLDKSGKEINSHILPATWSVGFGGLSATACIADSNLLTAVFDIAFDNKQSKIDSDCSFKLDISAWDGLPVRRLPSFHEVHAMFKGADIAESVRVILIKNGSEFPGAVLVNKVDSVRLMGEIVGLIHRLREIAKLAEIELIWDLAKAWDAFDEICEVHRHLFGPMTYSGPLELLVSDPAPGSQWKSQLETAENIRYERDMQVNVLSVDLGIFRESIEVNGFRISSIDKCDNGIVKVIIDPTSQSRKVWKKLGG